MSNRQQFVFISSSSSEPMSIKAIMIHFVDDTHLSYAVKRLRTIESVMNCELKKLPKWLRSNKLSLNSGKPELVIFSTKTKKEPDEITIKINKSKLSPVPNLNYLGIVLDEFLCWDAHVNNLCKKLVQTNGILSKLSLCSTKDLFFSIFLLALLVYFIRLLVMAIYVRNQS